MHPYNGRTERQRERDGERKREREPELQSYRET